MTRDEFDAHCHELSLVVEKQAKRVLRAHGFRGYIGTTNAPASFTELRARYHLLRFTQARYFPVLSTHCDDVIYDNAHVNMLYRAWHDLTHVELGIGFDFESEIAVAEHKAQFIPAGPMRDIMLADAVGESEFANATGGKFPRRQRQWAYDYVNHGFIWALSLHQHDTV